MSSWTRLYDGSALLSTADSNWSTPASGWSVSGGNIQQRTSNTQYFHNTAASATNMTLDMKVRVNSMVGTGSDATDSLRVWASWHLLQSGASDAWAFSLFTDRIVQSANGTSPTNAYVVDMTVFRRVTIVKIGTTHELWVDNKLRYTKTGANEVQGAGIWMGQASAGVGTLGANTDYAWIQYSTGDTLRPSAWDDTPDGKSAMAFG